MSEEPKAKKNRSPNHPSLPLETAVNKAKLLYDKYGVQPAPLLSACTTMGYKSVYSTSNQAVAALKAYGLADTSGKGDSRKVYITESGERIVRNAPDQAKLIREAALAPQIHKELWDHYNGSIPHDDILKPYLVWERTEGSRFTEDAVEGFMSRFRDTITYAKLIAGDESNKEDGGGEDGKEGENGGIPEGKPPAVQVGSFVQWTSQGQSQFDVPRVVKGFSDDGGWAFVEGSKAGIPMSELSVAEAPPALPTVGASQPPASPYFQPRPEVNCDGPEVRFPLDGGTNEVVIRLKKPVSKKDFDRITQLLQLSEDSLVDEED